MLIPVHTSIDRERAQAEAARAWARLSATEAGFPDRLFVAGTPDDVTAQLRGYWDAGCTDMILGVADQGRGYMGQLEILAREVLPAIRTFGDTTATRPR
jgi:alkanesulfonate monooxygenase SsuD/methylene tetrahydromethanopterin reductase-like flavin-dependent oxidoreductase (luciferase family)